MPPHILLLGGHGAIALLLTPLLLSRSYHITSVIRTAPQKPEILALQENHPGKINVLVRNLEDVKSEKQAREVVEEVRPGWVVWCAGEFPVCKGVGAGDNWGWLMGARCRCGRERWG
jgi:dTDP-4-dehydrorhamnose reductase